MVSNEVHIMLPKRSLSQRFESFFACHIIIGIYSCSA